MSDATDLLVQIGRMLEVHAAPDDGGADFDSSDSRSNYYFFRRAGLLAQDCDVTLGGLDQILRNLAKRLRAGESLGHPVFPSDDDVGVTP